MMRISAFRVSLLYLLPDNDLVLISMLAISTQWIELCAEEHRLVVIALVVVAVIILALNHKQ